MAIMASSSSLQFSSKSNPFLPSSNKPKPLHTFSIKASDPDTPETEPTKSTEPETQPTTTNSPESDSFENRLSQVRLRYKSGTGKKAELRKSKKSTKSGSNGGNGNVFLPPVPLKEPVSSNGLKVEMGFSPYTERLNGKLATLGLAALLLVELATGKTVITYHSPAIVFIQIYFVTAVSAVFVKYEKERISIWPEFNVVKQ